jgi:hypothetical protein
MAGQSLAAFDPAAFLSKAGRIVQLKTEEAFFSQETKATVFFTFKKVAQS